VRGEKLEWEKGGGAAVCGRSWGTESRSPALILGL
jgi:hypothetical protein